MTRGDRAGAAPRAGMPCPRRPGPGGWRCAPTRLFRAAARPRRPRRAHRLRDRAKRIAPLWRLLAGLAEGDWHDAIEMDNAQVAVAQLLPGLVAASTRC